MRGQRARRFVGVAWLALVGGCTALSGLGDLEVVDTTEAGIQSSSGVDGSQGRDGNVQIGNETGPSSSGDTGASSGQPDTGSSGGADVNVPDTGTPDTSMPDAAIAPDANQPDTGGPDTGPAGSGAVQCSANLSCSGQKPVCCFTPFFPVPTCAASTEQCQTSTGFRCDDDSDCTGGNICCVSWTLVSYEADSACAATCSSSAGGFGTKKGRACADSTVCDPTKTCGSVPNAPAPIRACQ